MKATLDYTVALQIITDGRWPDMANIPCQQPTVCASGRILFFHAGTCRIIGGNISVDGQYKGPARNIATLQQIAQNASLDLKCVITQQPKTPAPKKKHIEPKTSSVKPPLSTRTTKPTSLRDMLNAKKNRQPA